MVGERGEGFALLTGYAQRIFEAMRPEDRKEIMSHCWQKGLFTEEGEIVCVIPDVPIEEMTHPIFSRCQEEFLCEVMVACLLLPRDRSWDWLPVSESAKLYDVEEWVVRFRLVLKRVGVAG